MLRRFSHFLCQLCRSFDCVVINIAQAPTVCKVFLHSLCIYLNLSSSGPYDYFGEFGVAVDAMKADSNIPLVNNLIGPSVSGTWTPEEVWATNFIPTYTNSLGFLSVEQCVYPVSCLGSFF